MPTRPLLACVVLSAACSGPATHVHNPAAHRVFVDGQELPSAPAGWVLPFRYYGKSRWDAAPGDRDGKPDWSLQPAAGPIVMPEPASPWLFPFDFPLEVARRAFVGREDQTVHIQLPPTPPDLQVPTEVPPLGLADLLERAAAARVQR
ncbi:MAG: hypothetical protein KF830_18355 [Planctomycetes bacterium]|nr:hypothetical protein [Planctomycetota bacterium]